MIVLPEWGMGSDLNKFESRINLCTEKDNNIQRGKEGISVWICIRSYYYFGTCSSEIKIDTGFQLESFCRSKQPDTLKTKANQSKIRFLKTESNACL